MTKRTACRATAALRVLLASTLGAGLFWACAGDDASVGGGSGGAAGSGGSGGSGVGGGNWPDTGTDSTASGGGSSDAAIDAAPGGDCTRLGAWQSSAPFADASHVSHPLPSFGVGGYYYVHTMKSDGSERVLYSAQQNGDGSLGPWQIASPDHGGGPHGFTAIVVDGTPYHFRNGHIARYVLDTSGKMVGDVVLLEQSTDTSFGGNKYVWDSAVFAAFSSGDRYVVHLGGFSFTQYAYAPDIYRSGVPLQSSFDSMKATHPASRPGKVAFYSPVGSSTGFVFTGEGQGAGIWRASFSSTGNLGSFADLGSLPAGTGNERGDWFQIDGTLFVVRGSKVLGAHIDSAGGLAPWEPQPGLPEDQVDVSWGDGHLEGSAHGVLGDWVYLTGAKRVFFAPISRNQACN